jgi:Ca2+-binding RTX toxin-like protein
MVDITGSSKSDTIIGTQEHDMIYGLSGNDKIIGNDGPDSLVGGDGNDLIEGGLGEDYLIGENGNDKIYGEDGYDTLLGGLDNDFLDPGMGRNYVLGQEGNDTMVFHQDQPINLTGTSYQGGDGNDTLVFSDDFPITIQGVPLINQPIPGVSPSFYANAAYVDGIEVFDASASSKLLYIGQYSLPVKVIGSENNDTFYGREASEILIGGGGNDWYEGGDGSDTIISQLTDEDVFVFRWDTNSGSDTIVGFNGAGEQGGDLIDFSYQYSPGNGNSPVTVSEQNGNTIFDWEIGNLTVDSVGLVKGLDYFIYGM